MSFLKDIRVVDLTRLYPGPFASMILCDYGADVISIDPFSANSSMVYPLYRNKKHIVIDLKKKAGLDVFLRLVAKADIVLEGFRPGTADLLGIGYDSVRVVNRNIIYCSITGYGQNSSFKTRPGHDINYIAESGILSLIGSKNGPPCVPGIQIADVTGALYAVNAILAALYKREKTGEGEYIDISLTDSATSLLTLPMYMEILLNETQQRGDSILAHRYPWYDIYETKDEQFVAIGCLEPHFWKNLCMALDLEKFIPFQFEETKKEEIRQSFRTIFKSGSASYFESFFEDKDICFSIVRDMDGVKKSLLLKERNMILSFYSDIGDMFFPGRVAKFKECSDQGIQIPSFGADSFSVLCDLGFSREEISELVSSRIVYGKAGFL